MRQCFINQGEAGTTEKTLSRNVAVFFLGVLPDHDFRIVKRRKADMTALACQRDIGTIAVRNQAAYAQTGTGADNGFRRFFNRLHAADLYQVFFIHLGNRQSLSGEVVEQNQFFQTQRLAGSFDRKRPVVVGHLHPIAYDGIGNRNRRIADFRIADAVQVFLNRVHQSVVIVAGQYVHMLDFLRSGFQRKAGVGTADVGHQARPVGQLFFRGFLIFSGCSGHGRQPLLNEE